MKFLNNFNYNYYTFNYEYNIVFNMNNTKILWFINYLSTSDSDDDDEVLSYHILPI